MAPRVALGSMPPRARCAGASFAALAIAACLLLALAANYAYAADAYEPDDTMAQATTVTVDGAVNVRGWENLSYDWMVFEAKAGKAYQVTTVVDGYPFYGTAEATVMDKDSNVLAGGSYVHGYGTQPAWVIAPSDGPLYVRVYMYWDPYYSGPCKTSVLEYDPGRIEGSITTSPTALPVVGATVKAARYGAQTVTATTDANGHYVLPIADDRWPYSVSVTHPEPAYILPGPASVGVTRGQATDYSPPVYVPVSLTGTIRDSGTSQPLMGISVRLGGDPWTPTSGEVITDDNGRYTFGGLSPTQSVYVFAEDPNHEYVSASAGTGLAGTLQTTCDLSLAVGGRISGHLSDGSKGGGLSGLTVTVLPAGGGSTGWVTTTTVEGGAYVVSALPAGEYRVRFSDPNGVYGSISWDGTEYGWDSPPIQVQLGATTPDIDGTLYDHLAPVTTLRSVRSTWQRGPVTLELRAADQGWMGIDTTFLKVGSAPVTPYQGPISYNTEGVTTLVYWSQDGLATDGTRNIEETRTAVVRIDNTPPSTWLSAGTNEPGMRSFRILGRDSRSGIEAFLWRVDGVPAVGSRIVIAGAGDHTVSYGARDRAGNQSLRTITVRVAGASSASAPQRVLSKRSARHTWSAYRGVTAR